MGLFKSEAERKMERDLQVRQGILQIRKQIKDLERHEQEYAEKARRARRLGSQDQFAFLRKILRQTLRQRNTLERQLLAIEMAAQIKNQTEAYGAFARSMSAVSKAINTAFETSDLTRSQKDFELAMAKAESMEHRMSLFLDLTSQSLESGALADNDFTVSDAELDRVINAGERPGAGLDREVAQGLREIERELDGR